MGGHIGQGAIAGLAAGAFSITGGGPLWSSECLVEATETPGIVDVTLDTPTNELEFAAGLAPVGTTATIITLEHVSDSVKRIRTFDAAGTLADRSFSFVFSKK